MLVAQRAVPSPTRPESWQVVPSPKRDEGSGILRHSLTQFPGSPAVHMMLQPVPQPSLLHSSPVPSVHPSSLSAGLFWRSSQPFTALPEPGLVPEMAVCPTQQGSLQCLSKVAVDFLSAGQSPPAALKLLGDQQSRNVV